MRLPELGKPFHWPHRWFRPRENSSFEEHIENKRLNLRAELEETNFIASKSRLARQIERMKVPPATSLQGVPVAEGSN